MPILEDDNMDDRAVLWRCLGYAGEGAPVFDEPEEIWCEHRLRRTSDVGPDGTRMALDATMSAWEDLPLDSRVWVAPDHRVDALAQWYGTGSAGQADEVMRVRTRSKTRDMKNAETRYSYGLVWDRDADN